MVEKDITNNYLTVNNDIFKDFLPEDWFAVTDEYIKLQQNCIKVLSKSRDYEFDNANEIGEEILNSVGKLNELYLKKVQSENKSLETRRNYF
ncbi:hypothetical protein ACFQ4N_09415 [Oceanobacillus iheyensis]|uniref:hypothetical protein n=1 Tax=Oceanobacillus iheyensis TaxID=182710 RepID=UPI00362B979D